MPIPKVHGFLKVSLVQKLAQEFLQGLGIRVEWSALQFRETGGDDCLVTKHARHCVLKKVHHVDFRVLQKKHRYR